MTTVGMITIGQTPRDDLIPEFQKLLGPDFRLIEAGALDGQSVSEVAELAPRPGEFPLITRLADGTEVIVAKERLVPRLQLCLDGLHEEVDLFAVLCTGTFPPFRSKRPVLGSDRILFASTHALFSGGTLGVLLPLAGQAESAAARWSEISRQVAIEAESPYQGDSGLWEIGQRFRSAGASLIVVDCMGFTQAKKNQLRGASGVPVLLASSLLARFIAEVA
ncbi:MAG: AroM family protein [SAR324 cluster bacterium]|nr:AroM family protein [SAR324 cluster bacterium]